MKSITHWSSYPIAASLLIVFAAITSAQFSPALGQANDTIKPDEAQQLELVEVDHNSIFIGMLYDNSFAIVVAIVSAIISSHYTYFVRQDYKHRLRPILSWSSVDGRSKVSIQKLLDGGSKFLIRNSLDGGYELIIKVTNVGQAAAVDIVSNMTVVIAENDTSPPKPPPTTDFFGALSPNASVEIPIKLSDAQIQKIENGAIATFNINLKYKTVNNKEFQYKITGVYSNTIRFLHGPTSKHLPL